MQDLGYATAAIGGIGIDGMAVEPSPAADGGTGAAPASAH